MKHRHSWLLAISVMSSLGMADPTHSERLERPDATPVLGQVLGSVSEGFRFFSQNGREPLELGRASSVKFESTAVGALSTSPFTVILGRDQRVSGRLAVCDQNTIRLEDGPGGKPLTIERTGALALLQRSGEVLVINESFAQLDAARWRSAGSPSVAGGQSLTGGTSLKLPAGGSSVRYRLLDPVARGRLEIGFFDDGRTIPREQYSVEMVFRGDSGDESVKAILGWSEESLAVESPGGPALAVQRLTRKPGWRRLDIRFGSDRTEVSVDGDELAHGKRPAGVLHEVRLATQSLQNADTAASKDATAFFDDLRIVRFAEPSGEMEADPTQDELRLVSGDQSFGEVTKADGESITLKIEGRDVAYPWSEVSGIYFRRKAKPSRPVSGLLVRLEWRSASGNDPRDVDAADGVLVAATSDSLSIDTPNAGIIQVPKLRMRRLSVLGRGTRIVVDPFAHHLGDDVSEAPEHLDPPQPEGGILERTFDLKSPPGNHPRLIIEAVQVVGEAAGLRYSNKIRDGELVTNLYVNGKKIDYLNRYITTNNETPETVKVEIPPGLLKQGTNSIRFEQVGLKNDPTYLDDLGILGVTVEFDSESAVRRPNP